MSRSLKLAFGTLSLLLASGCATLTEGFYHEIAVDANAAGAYCTVSQDGNGLVDAVVAPGKLFVRKDRHASLHVRCKRDGYRTTEQVVAPITAGDEYPEKTTAGMGSALLTAGLSTFVDAGSGAGAWYPERVFVWMEKN